MTIVAEIPGFIQVFSDGTVKRFSPNISSSPATITAAASFKSRDVVIGPSKSISARIFVPLDDGKESRSRLPVLVYFHGGGFCFGSTTWPGYHSFIGGLCVTSRSIVLSVDYRLAPEHRLPAAYEDCYSSLKWLAGQAAAGGEPWLQNADLSSVFLSGESAGGNIVHNLGSAFSGNPEARMKEETGHESMAELTATDTLWRLSLPEGADRDHPFCNFERVELSESEWRGFPRVAVFLAGKDLLRVRETAYGAFLKSKAVEEVTVVTAEGEVHAHNVLYPQSEATKLLQSQIAEFMNRPR
ncbi:unnamed protein product [Spirodela intermedia]|uniref:Alpha/beta hydrolase fold-3 domain-containing protein n=1 Tax=Spirodela intermedia TaxID=51605 RepID=A0A7I8JAF4_SPIIN|nr:unnamed protein product [Spirodela intermedia]CAA6666412.1 unnamed protein product [Spirodela intermedia]